MTRSPETRVLFDATAIPRARGGVGRYIEGVLGELAKTAEPIVVVCQSRDVDSMRALGVRVVGIPARYERTWLRLVWEQLGLPALRRRLRADVIHSPHYTFPVVTTGIHVVTVHDLTFFTHPQVHSPLKRVFFSAWIWLTARLHLTTISDSESTARELERIVGARPSDNVVAPLGYSADLFYPPQQDAVDAFRANFAEGRDWVAFLGTLEPRKNVRALIEGFCLALSDADPSTRPALLLAGDRGWDTTVDAAVARAVGTGFLVKRVGYLELQELPALLGGAQVVAYPSLGEGFGLPVLEAMATGACVLTTRELSLPEVGGDAVAYSGTTAAEIGDALRDLLSNDSRRLELGQRGIQRAREFSWARTADAHRRAYSLARRDRA
jgi:glycosyltransferase involved in cell wall biosynthesis